MHRCLAENLLFKLRFTFLYFLSVKVIAFCLSKAKVCTIKCYILVLGHRRDQWCCWETTGRLEHNDLKIMMMEKDCSQSLSCASKINDMDFYFAAEGLIDDPSEHKWRSIALNTSGSRSFFQSLLLQLYRVQNSIDSRFLFYTITGTKDSRMYHTRMRNNLPGL